MNDEELPPIDMESVQDSTELVRVFSRLKSEWQRQQVISFVSRLVRQQEQAEVE
ncbi:hypothetical protein [Brucella endophytica]|uniref:hypothetical protein n=1 Tax=Brucella endophytica TaxID=1963359 RepID=UPI0016662B4E|nr:hypothetical protein [Brucella endophytica]